jgi:uncharacterized protein (TIGR02217 family)
MDVLPYAQPGLQWDIERNPEFSNLIQRAVSGGEQRASQRVYPLWYFVLAYEVLRDTPNVSAPSSPYDELKKLLGFFLKQQGTLKAFLYSDPSDNTVTDMPFALGNGSTAGFQLTRDYGAGGFAYTEPVQNLNGTVTNIKDNGSTVNPANYSVSATGFVTFSPVIANGHTLTWSGSYYYRCRFLADITQYKQFMQNLWANKKLDFVGSTMNKV